MHNGTKNRIGGTPFFRLLCAATVSNFGDMLHAVALPFLAVVWLDATPADMAGLVVAGLLPSVVFGLFAGAWIDRVKKRPILLAADWGRALAVLSLPAAAWFDSLTLAQLYVVAAINGLFRFGFDVAHVSYLPSLVQPTELVRANARLSASESVSEGTAFAASGWLIELFGAPIALVVDALTFTVSAMFLSGIHIEELGSQPDTRPSESELPKPRQASLLGDAAEGLRFVHRHPVLLPLIGSAVLMKLGLQIVGVVYMIFVFDELGFRPGLLGMIFAVGAISSFLGAMAAGRISSALGVGRTMVLGLLLFGISILVLPLAPGATLLGALALVLQQAGDGPATLFNINQTSLRQRLTPHHIMGRVNAFQELASAVAMLVGVALGAVLGEWLGLRMALAAGGSFVLLGALWLGFSSARSLR